MAKDNIRFSCGCGFQTEDYLEAMNHADTKKHTLDVLGKVQPNEPKVRKVKEDSESSPSRVVMTNRVRKKREDR